MPADNQLLTQLREAGTLVVSVKVIPRASRNEVQDATSESCLKVKVRAVPERGKANEEVCRLLAAYFGVPRGSVEVISGLTASQKRVRITKKNAGPTRK